MNRIKLLRKDYSELIFELFIDTHKTYIYIRQINIVDNISLNKCNK